MAAIPRTETPTTPAGPVLVGDAPVEPRVYLSTMPIIECHECGEATDLTGRPAGGTIEITCNRCGHSWLRDTEPSCPTCGSREVRPFKEPLSQRARGTAYSIVGERTVHLCPVCDTEEVERRSRIPDIEPAPREDPWK